MHALPPIKWPAVQLRLLLSDRDALRLEQWLLTCLDRDDPARTSLADERLQQLLHSPGWVAWCVARRISERRSEAAVTASTHDRFADAADATGADAGSADAGSADAGGADAGGADAGGAAWERQPWEELILWMRQFGWQRLLQDAESFDRGLADAPPTSVSSVPTPIQLETATNWMRRVRRVEHWLGSAGEDAASHVARFSQWRYRESIRAAWAWLCPISSADSRAAETSSGAKAKAAAATSPECDWSPQRWEEMCLPLLDAPQIDSWYAPISCQCETLGSLPCHQLEQELTAWQVDQQVELPELTSGFSQRLQRLARLWRRQQAFEAEVEQAKRRAMKELAYGASHEVNNPLANISTRAQTLLRDESDPERRQKLAMIDAQAMRAHEMIANMMLYAHPPALQCEEFALESVVDEALQSQRERAEQQGTELKRCLGGPGGQPEASHLAGRVALHPRELSLRINADRTQVLVLVQALVRNGLEAVAEGGRVEVEIAVHAEPPAPLRQPACCIRVRDTGPGVPAEIREHLFDPFFSGREAGRGLGFGLAKAWRIAELHEGHLRLAESTEAGAVFEVWLPLRYAAKSTQHPR